MISVRPETAGAKPPRSATIEELFATLESPLLGYALRLLGDFPRAEDAVQEAFMKLHAQFAEVREPRPWLYRTVRNLALNQRRQSAKVVPLPQPDGEETRETADPQPLPDELFARQEGIRLVRSSLKALDGRTREIVRLKFEDNLSYRQIGERTGLSATNVGYILHHAMKAIAAELARTGLTP